MIQAPASTLKGYISYPCCPKEKAMVWSSCHGRASYKCPKCGRFAMFDFDAMTAVQTNAARGVVSKMNNSQRTD